MGKVADFMKKHFGAEKAADPAFVKEVEEMEAELTQKQPETKTPPKVEPASDSKKTEGGNTDLSAIVNEAVTAAVRPLQEELDAIKTEGKNKAKTELEAKVEKALTEHVGKRWPEADKDALRQHLMTNYDTTIAMLERMPENPSVNRAASTPSKGDDKNGGGNQVTPAERHQSQVEAARASIRAAISAN